MSHEAETFMLVYMYTWSRDNKSSVYMCHKMRAVKYLLWSHCADMSSNVNSYHEPWSRDIHACVYVYYYSINTINGLNQNGSGLCLNLQNCTKVSIFANMRLLVFLLLINGRWNDLANLGQWKLTKSVFI